MKKTEQDGASADSQVKGLDSAVSGFRWAFGSASAAERRGASGGRSPEDEVVSLFDQLRIPVMRYLLASRVPVADAEEIVQEVFLLLFRKVCEGQNSENPTGWVFRTTHNFVMKHRDRVRRESGLVELSEVPDLTIRADVALEEAQRQSSLMAVVRALPERDQQCLHLRAEGLRYREIAEVLGMSLGAVANSLQGSMARLTRADER